MYNPGEIYLGDINKSLESVLEFNFWSSKERKVFIKIFLLNQDGNIGLIDFFNVLKKELTFKPKKAIFTIYSIGGIFMSLYVGFSKVPLVKNCYNDFEKLKKNNSQLQKINSQISEYLEKN